jgi:hypothetical protein
MEELLSQDFELDVKEFSQLLYVTQGIVAGSSVLSAYTGLFKPNDLDIWVYRQIPTNGPVHPLNYMAERNIMDLYVYVLEKQGYHRQGYNMSPSSEGYNDGDLQRTIKNIVNFTKNDKKIQIIYTNYQVEEVIEGFDFTICKIYWKVSKILTGTIISNYMKDIHEGIFYSNKDTSKPRELLRKEKYESRGFTFKGIDTTKVSRNTSKQQILICSLIDHDANNRYGFSENCCKDWWENITRMLYISNVIKEEIMAEYYKPSNVQKWLDIYGMDWDEYV